MSTVVGFDLDPEQGLHEIEHKLGQTDLIVQVYVNGHQQPIPDIQIVDENNIKVALPVGNLNGRVVISASVTTVKREKSSGTKSTKASRS